MVAKGAGRGLAAISPFRRKAAIPLTTQLLTLGTMWAQRLNQPPVSTLPNRGLRPRETQRVFLATS